MNHNNMSVGELADFFATVSRQRIQQILKKYQDRGDEQAVVKILQAKKILKDRKYEDKYGYHPNIKQAHSIYRGVLSRVGKREPYLDCSVEWGSESEFRQWAVRQIGFDKGFELDKDILIKGNRIYGPDTCVFVPPEINVLLSGCYRSKRRGQYPIGVSFNKGSGYFVSQMSNRQEKGPVKYLGSFPTVEAAFACYKAAKEARIKAVAEKWKNQIDPRAYAALMARTVDWDD